MTPASGRLPRGSARHPGGRLPGTGPGALQPPASLSPGAPADGIPVSPGVPWRGSLLLSGTGLRTSANHEPVPPGHTFRRASGRSLGGALRLRPGSARPRPPALFLCGASITIPEVAAASGPHVPLFGVLFSPQWTAVPVQEVFGFSLFRVICVVSISSLIHIFFSYVNENAFFPLLLLRFSSSSLLFCDLIMLTFGGVCLCVFTCPVCSLLTFSDLWICSFPEIFPAILFPVSSFPRLVPSAGLILVFWAVWCGRPGREPLLLHIRLSPVCALSQARSVSMPDLFFCGVSAAVYLFIYF